jgi:branched-chain amino acid transport system permease protein
LPVKALIRDDYKPPSMVKSVAFLRDRAEVGVLGLVILSIFVLPTITGESSLPFGSYGVGLVGGAALTLQAIGVLLVYRSNRIINFAQVQVGAVAAAFFVAMVQLLPLVRLIQTVCPPCLVGVSPGFLRFNYYLALVLAVLMALGISYLLYFVARRFQNAPRLILTVATIFIAQLLAGVQGWLPNQLASEEQLEQEIQLTAAGPPFQLSFKLGGQVFDASDVLTVIAAVLAVVLLTLYFKLSPTGIAIRAAAENADRAKTLGINTTRVTGRVWLISGLLSAVVGILIAMSLGASTQASLSVSGLVRILAVVVIARLVSLPMAIAAAAVLGVFEQAVLWFFSSVTPLDGLLLVIIGLVLMVQRYRGERAEVIQASGWRASREVRPIPEELRSLPTVRKWLRTGAFVGSIFILGIPWVMSPSQTNLATGVMIVGMVTLSLLVLTGWAGQISLGQFAFAGIGGYVAAIMPGPFVFRLLIAAVAGGISAVIVGLPALKMRGLHLAITTLAFALATTAFLLNPNYLGRALPPTLDRPSFIGMDFDDGRIFYYFTLLMLTLVFFAVLGLRRSRTARALIAARDNEQAAQSLGINLVRSRLAAFAISGFIAALAGALFAFQLHGVRAIAYAPEVSVRMFLITVIGGLGSVSAPLVGAFLFEGVLSLVSTSPIVGFIATGGGGLLLLVLAPGGLAQVFFDIRDAVLRSIARRQGIIVPSLLADVEAGSKFLSVRSPIAPKLRTGGSSAFVPRRYALSDQWALDIPAEVSEKAVEDSPGVGDVIPEEAREEIRG